MKRWISSTMIAATLALTPRTAEIVIDDNGVGLPVRGRSELTEPYVTTREKGTGLGLAISQRFCQMMAGELTVKSALGEGSTFYARVPRKVPERPSTLRQTRS